MHPKAYLIWHYCMSPGVSTFRILYDKIVVLSPLILFADDEM